MKIIDMHCDTATKLLEAKRQNKPIGLRKNKLHIDLMRMKKSGYLLQNFALAVDIGRCFDPWQEFVDMHQCLLYEFDLNSDLISPVFAFADIEKNETQNKISALIAVEDGEVCCGDTEKLKSMYEMGVRMITLTWNYPNKLGFPNQNYFLKNKLPETENGLTEKGREMVGLMEKLGIIIDVSHLSDKGFYDLLECTKKPFVASHSNTRSICNHVRNLTDDMLKSLGERSGCVGLNFHLPFLSHKRRFDPVSALVRHAKQVKNLAGIEAVALGSDFDGIDQNPQLEGAQSIAVLWQALNKNGFTPRELDKIFFSNPLRLYKATLK